MERAVVLRFFTILFLAAALIPRLSFSLPNGAIGVLYIGGLYRSAPFDMMKSDPLFSMEYVPASLRADWVAKGGLTLRDVHRMIRMYMPRTDKEIRSRFDVVVLASANVAALGLRNIEMIAKAVRDEGVGLFMSGGWEGFGGFGGWQPWGDTAVGKLLPVNDIVGMFVDEDHLVIDKPNNELIRSLPWNHKDPVLSQPIRWGHNPVTLKNGPSSSPTRPVAGLFIL